LVVGLKDGWFTGSGYKDGRGTGFFQCSFSGSVCPVLVSFFFLIALLESEAAEVLEFGCWKFGILISIAGIWELKIWD
jgi:hypothetical protein